MPALKTRNTMDVDAIPVHVVKGPEEESGLAVEFGSTSTFAAPLIGTAQPVQILQRRVTRYKSILYVPSLVTGLTPVVPITLGASTVAAYNPNSVGVNATITGGTVTAIAVNGVTTGLTSGTVFVPAGGTLTVTYTVAPALATAYPPGVTVAATVAGALYLASRQDFLANPNNPQGFAVTTSPFIVTWESQQPCYAAAIGSGPVNVSVIDQAQGAPGAVAEEAIQREDFPDESYQQEGGRNYGEPSDGNRY
jgi:hypothetical protein